MALIDLNAADPVLDAARFAKTLSARDTGYAVPHQALDRLSALRGEAGHTLHLLRFLGRSPQACLCLMLAGAVTLIWASRGDTSATLQSDFFWVLSVLAGVVAVTGNYIRAYARGARRLAPHKAATELRLLLLYTGAAWGLGAFLVMPELPMPALAIAFAAAPSLALTLLLRDRKGAIAFTAPVILAGAGAAIVGAWPFALWVAAAILVAGMAIVCLSMLQREIPVRRNALPAAVLH